MFGMQAGQRIDFHEAGRAGGIAPQIDPAGVATIQDSPGGERGRLGRAHLLVAVGMDQAIFDQLFAAFFVDVRISVGFGPGQQDDLQRAQRGPRRQCP